MCKSLIQTTDNLYTSDDLFEKEYDSFMVNRIMSHSPQTALFAEAMNSATIDKKIQYDFYRLGIPKSNTYIKWNKKDEIEYNEVHITYLCDKLNVSVARAMELYPMIGSDNIQKKIDSKGGRA